MIAVVLISLGIIGLTLVAVLVDAAFGGPERRDAKRRNRAGDRW